MAARSLSILFIEVPCPVVGLREMSIDTASRSGREQFLLSSRWWPSDDEAPRRERAS